MGSILIGILIDVVILVFVAWISYGIDRQRGRLDVAAVVSELDTAHRRLHRAYERIDFLQAENDQLQKRAHRLENHLVAGAHLHAMPPPDATAQALGLVGRPSQGPRISKEVLKALGPSEPPTPKGHKEVG